MRERGFSWLHLVIVLAIVGATAAVLIGVYGQGKSAGRAEVQSAWDKAKAEAAAAELARAADVSEALKEAEERRAAAQRTAEANESKWKEALREARRNRKPLAACESSGSDPQPVADAAPGAGGNAAPGIRQTDLARRGGDGPRLLWRFVGLHDGAFAGLDGQPLFGASAQFALDPARADAASPYGLDELLEVHGENVRALNACRRAYFGALNKIDAAAHAWGRGR